MTTRKDDPVLSETAQQLIQVALGAHAEKCLQLSRRRSNAGPQNAARREYLRETARACDELALRVRECNPRELAWALGLASLATLRRPVNPGASHLFGCQKCSFSTDSYREWESHAKSPHP